MLVMVLTSRERIDVRDLTHAKIEVSLMWYGVFEEQSDQYPLFLSLNLA